MAHSNTIFYQLLQLLDTHDFQKIEQNGFQTRRKYRALICSIYCGFGLTEKCKIACLKLQSVSL